LIQITRVAFDQTTKNSGILVSRILCDLHPNEQ
jgi:hypothetical protein